MIAYVPTGLASVAAVVKVSVPPSDAKVSPLTKPVMVDVSGGLAAPYVLDLLSAVIVSVVALTVSVPAT